MGIIINFGIEYNEKPIQSTGICIALLYSGGVILLKGTKFLYNKYIYKMSKQSEEIKYPDAPLPDKLEDLKQEMVMPKRVRIIPARDMIMHQIHRDNIKKENDCNSKIRKIMKKICKANMEGQRHIMEDKRKYGNEWRDIKHGLRSNQYIVNKDIKNCGLSKGKKHMRKISWEKVFKFGHEMLDLGEDITDSLKNVDLPV